MNSPRTSVNVQMRPSVIDSETARFGWVMCVKRAGRLTVSSTLSMLENNNKIVTPLAVTSICYVLLCG